METVSVVGVPEHFNLPWHMAMEEEAFLERGIHLQWTDVPEGTGRMCQMLREGAADMAVILTEGVIRDIHQGNPSRIVQTYVASPLLWGVHVGANAPYHKIEELKHTKAAISRYGSGSHLMSYVLAQREGWDTSSLQFKIVNTLEGAKKALTDGEADHFLWEHFTTKPVVDAGIFRRLGDCPTPWPCFVIAAHNDLIADSLSVISHILDVINTYTRDFKHIPSIDRTIANKYSLQLEDVRQWLTLTHWSQSLMNEGKVEEVQVALLNLRLIDQKLPVSKLCESRVGFQ